MGTVGHKGQKVLVIDDDPVMHRLFGNILHQVGYTVMVANCGLTGLDLAEHDQPQIIILDYVMPDMDGLETLKELKSRESTRSIPVLIATGYLDAPSSEKFMTAAAIDRMADEVYADVHGRHAAAQPRFADCVR